MREFTTAGLILGLTALAEPANTSASGSRVGAQDRQVACPTDRKPFAFNVVHRTGALRVGETVQLEPVVFAAHGVKAVGCRPKYRSSNGRLITVSDAGLVTAIAPGQAEVIATLGGVERRLGFLVRR